MDPSGRSFHDGHDHDFQLAAAGTALTLGRRPGGRLDSGHGDPHALVGPESVVGPAAGSRPASALLGMILTVVAVQMLLDGVRLFIDGRPRQFTCPSSGCGGLAGPDNDSRPRPVRPAAR